MPTETTAVETVLTIVAAHTNSDDLTYRGSCSLHAIMLGVGILQGPAFRRSAFMPALEALVAGGFVHTENTMWGLAYRAA